MPTLWRAVRCKRLMDLLVVFVLYLEAKGEVLDCASNVKSVGGSSISPSGAYTTITVIMKEHHRWHGRCTQRIRVVVNFSS
ncbi:hypothetical protein J1N35_033772 [Gossypium stocksii]|uniref:Secreted protein n=1 Tax=Gossypium stocksii TaxID=47602 RepID=A0A9D3UQU4_9ROSI|nr:hypothetical protein J1N35_033772 [Gossypium stocksii]